MRKKHKKRLGALFVTAAAALFFRYPKDTQMLFLALPEETAVAIRAHNLAYEYKAFAHNPVVTGMLERAGMDARDIGNFKKNAGAGVFWTLFGLTGKDSVVGYVPTGNAGGNMPYLAGASYTGFRARFIELLWRLKWVPGLGDLGVSEHGTRYLEFDTAPGFEHFRYLGLDIRKGILYATYSSDPDDVLKLIARAGAKSQNMPVAFLHDSPPWKSELAGTHKIWLSPGAVGDEIRKLLPFDPARVPPLRAHVGSFKSEALGIGIGGIANAEIFAGAKTFGEMRGIESPCADVAGAAGGAFKIAGDASLLSPVLPLLGIGADAAREGIFAAYVSGKPYEGRIMQIAVPALSGGIRCADAQSAAQLQAAFKFAFDTASLMSLGTFKPVVSRDAETLVLGTDKNSLQKQRENAAQNALPSLGSIIDSWRSAHPATVLFAETDLETLGAEVRKLGAVAKLAEKTMGKSVLGKFPDAVRDITEIFAILPPRGTASLTIGKPAGEAAEISLTIILR